MPRFFFEIGDNERLTDDEGTELPNRQAVRRELHRTLAEIMQDSDSGRASTRLRADVHDDAGNRIMTATLVMAITEPD